MNRLKNAPYPGLRPFEQRESVYFFGRSQQIAEIVARLRRRHFAAIIGGSGCGKSSLVRAGVIPELLSYAIEEEGDFWIPVIYNPEDMPIHRLAEALDQQLEPIDSEGTNGPSRIERLRQIRSLLEWGDGLSKFLETFRHELRVEPGCEDLREEANLLVVVDQFEEIFRKPAQAQEVLQLTELILETYSNPQRRIYLILTMRSEDLHRCAQFLRLPEVLNECAYLARRLDERELRDAIVNPAALEGAVGEVTALGREESAASWDRAFDIEVLKPIYADAATIRDDPDHLPLLQHLLFQLWRVAVARSDGQIPSSITVSDLNTVLAPGKAPANQLPNARSVWRTNRVGARVSRGKTGSPSLLRKCLAVSADEVYRQLSDEQQRIAETMFKLLADIDDTGTYKRRWTNRREVANVAGLANFSDPNLETVVSKFSDPHRYIRCDGKGAEDKIDVSHEALIRNWPRFVDWVAEEKIASIAYRDLTDNYRSWNTRCRNISGGTWRFLSRIVTTNLDKRLASRAERQLGFTPWMSPAKRMTAATEKNRPRYRINSQWAKRYQSDSETGQYENVLAYYRASQRKRIVARGSVFSLLLLVSVLSVGWVISSQEADIAQQRAEVSRQEAKIAQQRAEISAQSETMFRHETMFFHPLVVASKIRFLDGNTPESYKYAAVWQAAVALKSVQDVQGAFYTGMDQVEGTTWDRKRWTRLIRAIRLAHEGTNGAARMVSSAVLWPRHSLLESEEYPLLSGESAVESNEEHQALLTACGASSDDGWPRVEVFTNDRAEFTRWDAAVLDSSKPLCVARKTSNRGWEKVSEVPWSVDPTGGSVWLDPSLRFYAISKSYSVSEPSGSSSKGVEATRHLLTLQRLIWYEVLYESTNSQEPVGGREDSEANYWKLMPGKVFSLNFEDPFQVAIVGRDAEHLRIKRLKCDPQIEASCQQDYLVRWDVEQNLMVPPIDGADNCRRVEENSDPDVTGAWLCGENGQYQLVEKKGKSQKVRPDVHLLEVQMSMGRPGDSPKTIRAFKAPYPIAQFQFYGSKIEDVWFSDAGEIYLQTSIEKHRQQQEAHRIIWGGDALLQVLCDVLDRHPDKDDFTLTYLKEQKAFSPAFQELSGIEDAIVNKFHKSGPCY